MQTFDALQQDYRQLRAELGGDQVGITKREGQLKVTFTAGILYPECAWQRNSQARATLNKSVPTLQCLQHAQSVVNGYTDNVPVGPEPLRMDFVSDLASQLRRGRAMPEIAGRGSRPSVAAGLR